MRAIVGEPRPGIRQVSTMIVDPVSVPTSGISENSSATTARTAGNGASMMLRKIQLRMPLMTPRLAWPIT